MNTIATIPLCFMGVDGTALAGGAAVDTFLDDMDELAMQFFARFRPPRRRSGRLHLRPGPRDVERVLLHRTRRHGNSTAWSASGGSGREPPKSWPRCAAS